LLASVIVWQFGFALTAEKALFALLLGSMFAPASDAYARVQPSANPRRRAGVLLGAVMMVFAALSYWPKDWIDLDHLAPWRRPERALVQFERARTAISTNQGAVALAALDQAVQLDPWRSDLARARAQLALELRHNEP
jgi:hypothetical protein